MKRKNVKLTLDHMQTLIAQGVILHPILVDEYENQLEKMIIREKICATPQFILCRFTKKQHWHSRTAMDKLDLSI